MTDDDARMREIEEKMPPVDYASDETPIESAFLTWGDVRYLRTRLAAEREEVEATNKEIERLDDLLHDMRLDRDDNRRWFEETHEKYHAEREARLNAEAVARIWERRVHGISDDESLRYEMTLRYTMADGRFCTIFRKTSDDKWPDPTPAEICAERETKKGRGWGIAIVRHGGVIRNENLRLDAEREARLNAEAVARIWKRAWRGANGLDPADDLDLDDDPTPDEIFAEREYGDLMVKRAAQVEAILLDLITSNANGSNHRRAAKRLYNEAPGLRSQILKIYQGEPPWRNGSSPRTRPRPNHRGT